MPQQAFLPRVFTQALLAKTILLGYNKQLMKNGLARNWPVSVSGEIKLIKLRHRAVGIDDDAEATSVTLNGQVQGITIHEIYDMIIRQELYMVSTVTSAAEKPEIN